MPSDAVEPEGLIQILHQIIELMIGHPEKFDEYSATNIQWIGPSFIAAISDIFEVPKEKRTSRLVSIFVSAYRFLCELEFTQPSEPSFEVRRVIGFVHDNLESFSGADRQQLVYAAYTMPAQVTKRLLGHPSITEFRIFSETIEKSRQLKDEWDKQLSDRQTLLAGLDSSIRKLTSEYNFVGLVHGFQALRRQKEAERKFAFVSLIVLALAMIAPPVLQLSFVVLYIDAIESHKSLLIYTLPTILALEVMLIYFFRVVLGQFRSVKAQLLQIDLRISLCQFVESYAEYVTKMRSKDSSVLSKFEALIFSGLVTEEAGIPSTFDGAEQIASLIRSIRGGER